MFRKPLTLLFFGVLIASTLVVSGASYAKNNAIRQDAQLVVQATALGLSGLLQDVEERVEQERLIRVYVHASRFFPDKSGYLFVYDRQGRCIAHGVQRDLEGKDLIDFRDSTGAYVIRLMIKKIEEGGGYVDYMWKKPDTTGERAKLGYVLPIIGTDFFIGTGVYYPEP